MAGERVSEWITRDEAAKIAGRRPITIWDMAKRGRIRSRMEWRGRRRIMFVWRADVEQLSEKSKSELLREALAERRAAGTGPDPRSNTAQQVIVIRPRPRLPQQVYEDARRAGRLPEHIREAIMAGIGP